MTEPVQRQKRVEVDTIVHVCPARGCGREFKPKRSDQVYCGDLCRWRAWDDRRKAFHEEPNGY